MAQHQYVSATIKPGQAANSIKIVLKSNTDFTARFTNLQFLIQLPLANSVQPDLMVTQNHLSSYFNANYSSWMNSELGYQNYHFNTLITDALPFSFNAGVEYDALEIAFSGGLPNAWYEARLGHLSGGGSSMQSALYIEMGEDYTNYNDMFYGEDANNGGGYTSFSFVPLHYNTVDLRLLQFDANRKDRDNLLQWQFKDQQAEMDSLVLERSDDGLGFQAIARFIGSFAVLGNFRDINRLVGSYYRLKWKSVSNNWKYGPVKYLAVNSENAPLFVFPNPVSKTLTASFQVKRSGSMQIRMVDQNGKIFRQSSIAAAAGINYASFFVDELPAGTYVLMISDGKEWLKTMFIKL
jgi:hypothetical protein